VTTRHHDFDDSTGLKHFDHLQKGKTQYYTVIPAKAGIMEFDTVKKHWIPAFAGMTTYYGFIIINWHV
jgi:hypothetical protein